VFLSNPAPPGACLPALSVCSGIHPDFTGATYLDILAAAKAGAPDIHVHAFSPLEVTHVSRGGRQAPLTSVAWLLSSAHAHLAVSFPTGSCHAGRVTDRVPVQPEGCWPGLLAWHSRRGAGRTREGRAVP
jgi:hypothetical protein